MEIVSGPAGSSERWKGIPGKPGREVSSHGRVRSWVYRNGKPGRLTEPRLVPGYINAKGYLTVYGQLVHRLVLIVFRGPPPSPDHVACHIDGDATNNRLGNLRWGTAKENEADKERHGTKPVGESNGRSVLTLEDVEAMRERVANGESTREVANDFPVSYRTAWKAITGKTWSHVPNAQTNLKRRRGLD